MDCVDPLACDEFEYKVKQELEEAKVKVEPSNLLHKNLQSVDDVDPLACDEFEYKVKKMREIKAVMKTNPEENHFDISRYNLNAKFDLEIVEEDASPLVIKLETEEKPQIKLEPEVSKLTTSDRSFYIDDSTSDCSPSGSSELEGLADRLKEIEQATTVSQSHKAKIKNFKTGRKRKNIKIKQSKRKTKLDCRDCTPDEIKEALGDTRSRAKLSCNCHKLSVNQKQGYDKTEVENIVHRKNCRLSNPPSVCKICFQTFSKGSNLNRHTKDKHSNVVHSCDECDFKTLHPTSLLKHKLIHLKSYPFKCKLCHYKCNQSGSLRRHMACVHLKVKTFSCNECGYVCSRKDLLFSHISKMH